MLEAIASAISNVFGLLAGRSVLRNAPEMKTNATARADARLKDTTVRTVAGAATGDAKELERLRKLAAE
jgi:hypothetical protein